MSEHDNIDFILRNWTYEPATVNARIVQGDDGRDVLQMRVDLGVLQLETTGRPDGSMPYGASSVLEHLQEQAAAAGEDYELSEEDCFEVDREFVQFYHRRICWLQLRRFEQAILDANHTLALMDLCRDYGPDEQWTMAHEQYRPFVMFHKIQAQALLALDEDEGAEAAIEAISQGLDSLRQLYESYEMLEKFDEDELVKRLIEIREDIRTRYDVGQTLRERLADAVATEQYELAAQLRDELERRDLGPR